jgi:hypothetical protein
MAIQERQLPFTEHTVHVLVRQALFHVGKISNGNNGRPVLEWKTDLESPIFGQDSRIILESFYQEIKDSPRSYMCVKLIGMLCNFFSKWEHCCRITARNLAASVFQWAEELDGEIEKSPPSLAPGIQAKQAVLFQHAILVLIGGDFNESDISLLIKMIVKSRNIFTEDFRSDEIRANATEIKYGICQKVKNILQVATQAPTMMTSVLRSVIPRCPAVLDWLPWKSENNSCTQCFEARCDDGCFYSINVISGEVLINGLPPSRLPQSVVAHPLYMRTFGDSNFEVVEKGDFLETLMFRNYRLNKFHRVANFGFAMSSIQQPIEERDASPLSECIDPLLLFRYGRLLSFEPTFYLTDTCIENLLLIYFKLSVVVTLLLVATKPPISIVFFCRHCTKIYKTCIISVSVDVIYRIIAILKKPFCLRECGKYCLV